jgi:hypothetical protein
MTYLPRTFALACCMFFLSCGSALADYSTVVQHGDGSKTTIESKWSTKSSTVTTFDEDGQKLTEKEVPGGAGQWSVHKKFVKQYLKSGSKASNTSPSFSPVGKH